MASSRTLTDALKGIDIETKTVKTTGNGDIPDYETSDSGWDDEILLFIGKNVDTSRGKIDYIYNDSLGSQYENTTRFQSGADLRDRYCATWQIKHTVDRDVPVVLHGHILEESNQAKTILWKARYRIRKNGALPGSWSSWTTGTKLITGLTSDKLQVYDFGTIDLTGTHESDMVEIQFGRGTDESSSDGSGLDGYLSQLDLHVKRRHVTGSQKQWSWE